MNTAEAKAIIATMSEEELINYINDSVDTNEFPLGLIKPIDDSDWWDEIGEEIGGYALMKALEESKKGWGKTYFVYDEDVQRLEYFANKKEIVDYYGMDNLVDNYIESLDY